MMKHKVLVLPLILFSQISAGLFSTDYAQQRPEDAIAKLQAKQVDYPNDPEINYNLGVAQYRAKKYADAQANFKRAAEDSSDANFRQKAYFNLGNSFYREALSLLPKNWQKKETKLEQSVLQKAIEQTQASLDTYKKIIENDEYDEKTQVNKKKAEELLKQLQDKQEQQKQQEQEQNKDQEKLQDKQNDKQDQSQQKNDQEQDKQSKDEKKENERNQNDQNQPQGNGEDDTENSQGQQPEGEQDKPEDKSSKDEQKQDGQDTQHDQDSSEKEDTNNQAQTHPENTQEQENAQEQQAAAGQEAEEEEEESMEKRGMRALLQNLEQDEADAQKRFMMQKMNEAKPPLKSGQKPW